MGKNSPNEQSRNFSSTMNKVDLKSSLISQLHKENLISERRKNFRKLNKLNLKRIESYGYFPQMQDKAAAAIRSSRQKLLPLKLDPLRHSDCRIAKNKFITV